MQIQFPASYRFTVRILIYDKARIKLLTIIRREVGRVIYRLPLYAGVGGGGSGCIQWCCLPRNEDDPP